MKNLQMLLGLTLSAPFALSLLSAASAQSTHYNFTNFNAGGAGASTIVRGISSSGVVVGSYFSGNGSTNFTGTLGAFKPLNLGDVFVGPTAFGINAAGQVVGQDGGRGAFLSSPAGTPVLLPEADPYEVAQAALGINDSSVIVGDYYHADESTISGFVYAAGKFTLLDPSGTPTQAFAQGISNNGLVIGNYNTTNQGQTQGFTYDTRSGAYSLLANPNVSNLDFAHFSGINDSNIAVGYYQTLAGVQHGFLYNVNSQAYTFLDDPNAAPSSIAFPAASLMQITGISDGGEIAGFFTSSANQQLGFIATPAAVPEASSVVSLGLLLALGAGGAYAAKRRKVAA